MACSKTMFEKLQEAAPYNILYNTIPELPASQNSNFISFSDFLCPSLGALKCSLQIVSKVDLEWVMEQYESMNVGETPLTIVYAEDVTTARRNFSKDFANLTLHEFTAFEQEARYNHHEKIGIYIYEDNSLRVVIYTSNLHQTQWEHYNHGFWVSPVCRHLSDNTSGESPTNFKKDLLKFLTDYKLPVLNNFIQYVKMADFSHINVFLMASRPGHYSPDDPNTPLNQMAKVIQEHCLLPPHDEPSWPLVAQASNMGQFGVSPDDWLLSFFLKKLVPHTRAKLKIVFPTWKQVMQGFFDSELVGTGLRYSRKIHDNQKWINNYLYCWGASDLGRSKILPHTKTYCRLSPCWKKMAWFLLTTGNINRGAWGQMWNSNVKTPGSRESVFVRNYEIGVMFFPKFFNEVYFRVKNQQEKKFQGDVFPLVYDVPLKKYSERDHPWSVSGRKR